MMLFMNCRRMEDLKSSEQRATVEDLMYASVLEKFLELKVEMMPRCTYLIFLALAALRDCLACRAVIALYLQEGTTRVWILLPFYPSCALKGSTV